MIFCKHDWQLLSEIVTESNAEQAKRIGLKNVKGFFVFDRKLVQIVTCKKCGKLKKFVTDI